MPSNEIPCDFHSKHHANSRSLSASILSDRFGDLGITLEPCPDHADYIGHWLRILKADQKAIFTAASAANKASEFLMTFFQTQQREGA
jgi:antirestriction protein ArdC